MPLFRKVSYIHTNHFLKSQSSVGYYLAPALRVILPRGAIFLRLGHPKLQNSDNLADSPVAHAFGTTIAISFSIEWILSIFLEDCMLRAALGFFVLALLAVVFGASGVAGVSMEIGRMLLIVFLILAVISFVIGIVSGRGPNIRP